MMACPRRIRTGALASGRNCTFGSHGPFLLPDHLRTDCQDESPSTCLRGTLLPDGGGVCQSGGPNSADCEPERMQISRAHPPEAAAVRTGREGLPPAVGAGQGAGAGEAAHCRLPRGHLAGGAAGARDLGAFWPCPAGVPWAPVPQPPPPPKVITMPKWICSRDLL